MISMGRVYDVVGIGFGPANLALAVAARETDDAPTMRFIERRRSFAWHPGMLLPGSRMQVSFLKDMATLRDPTSAFSFLNYLKQHDRLDEFVNLGTFRPSRAEYHDYLSWVAGHFVRHVEYGHEVTRVEPLHHGSRRIEALRVHLRSLDDERERVLVARNVVVATGGRPHIPAAIKVRPGGPVFHTERLLDQLAARFPNSEGAHRFAVVGDGQSAAEAFLHLIDRYPAARVTAVTRGPGYRPMDESAFVNELFFPRAVDLFYGMEPERRAALLRGVRDTNYAVVDADLIETLYRRLYEERVAGCDRLGLAPFCDLVGADPSSDGREVEMTLRRETDRSVQTHPVDGLVLATGYRSGGPHPVLAGLTSYLRRDRDGEYQATRDYRLQTSSEFEPGVYLQGHLQRSHGIGDTLLSLMSVRAGEIVVDIRAHRRPAERVPLRVSTTHEME